MPVNSVPPAIAQFAAALLGGHVTRTNVNAVTDQTLDYVAERAIALNARLLARLNASQEPK